ncbi:MAG: hypothetical protein JSV50_00265 [Desulfobacteraceae bacterium]|nr:MAG: hypothetical protein JSV50_00265 [Desulfobacteraceae bacterium]
MTVENFVARASQLYEQKPGEPCGPSRLGLYVRRWLRWFTAGGVRLHLPDFTGELWAA